MKTFVDFKHEVRLEIGYKIIGEREKLRINNEAAERYANYKAEIAHDNACRECIDAVSDEVVGESKRYAIENIESILKNNPYKKQ